MALINESVRFSNFDSTNTRSQMTLYVLMIFQRKLWRFVSIGTNTMTSLIASHRLRTVTAHTKPAKRKGEKKRKRKRKRLKVIDSGPAHSLTPASK